MCLTVCLLLCLAMQSAVIAHPAEARMVADACWALSQLHLCRVQITSPTFFAELSAACPQLRRLTLSSVDLPPSQPGQQPALAALAAPGSLQSLEAFEVQDMGAEHFSDPRLLRRVTHLQLLEGSEFDEPFPDYVWAEMHGAWQQLLDTSARNVEQLQSLAIRGPMKFPAAMHMRSLTSLVASKLGSDSPATAGHDTPLATAKYLKQLRSLTLSTPLPFAALEALTCLTSFKGATITEVPPEVTSISTLQNLELSGPVPMAVAAALPGLTKLCASRVEHIPPAAAGGDEDAVIELDDEWAASAGALPAGLRELELHDEELPYNAVSHLQQLSTLKVTFLYLPHQVAVSSLPSMPAMQKLDLKALGQSELLSLCPSLTCLKGAMIHHLTGPPPSAPVCNTLVHVESTSVVSWEWLAHLRALTCLKASQLYKDSTFFDLAAVCAAVPVLPPLQQLELTNASVPWEMLQRLPGLTSLKASQLVPPADGSKAAAASMPKGLHRVELLTVTAEVHRLPGLSQVRPLHLLDLELPPCVVSDASQVTAGSHVTQQLAV